MRIFAIGPRSGPLPNPTTNPPIRPAGFSPWNEKSAFPEKVPITGSKGSRAPDRTCRNDGAFLAPPT